MAVKLALLITLSGKSEIKKINSNFFQKRTDGFFWDGEVLELQSTEIITIH